MKCATIKILMTFIFLSLNLNQNVFSANSTIPPSPSISLLQTVVGLIIIIGLILFAAWFMRKVSPNMGASSLLRVISAISVGPREKVVVVEIDEQWLVLGVTSTQVNLLQTLPKGMLPAFNKLNHSSSSSFLCKLKEAMKRHG